MLNRRVYIVLSCVLTAAAFAGVGVVLYAGIFLLAFDASDGWSAYGVAMLAGAACYVLLPPHILVHELGHAVCGLCARMRLPVFRVGRLEISRRGVRYRFWAGTAGETAIVPSGGAHIKGRLVLTALGGALFNLLYVAVVLSILFLRESALTPALYFFLLFTPLSLAEGILALVPCETGAGRTDGGVICGIVRKDAETDVTLRVLQAQGIAQKEGYAAIPAALLDEAPVIREDARAFAALLFLKYERAKQTGDRTGAERAFARLVCIEEYLTAEECAFLQKEKGSAQSEVP